MSDRPEKSAAEVVMDLAVFAPLGLALTISEVVPQLVEKGRARFGAQVALARTIGQLAVRQGVQQLRSSGGRARVPNLPPFPFRGSSGLFGWPGGRSSGAPGNQATDGHDRARGSAAGGTVDLDAARSTRVARPSAETTAVSAADLAIPSYDSLSASQVAQRLAGLSREEVEAVRAYEARTRGRRTVLARAEQLLA